MQFGDHLPRVLFVVSLIIFSWLYGLATVQWSLPPYELMRTTWSGVQDFAEFWKNDLNIEPVRQLVPAYPGSERFTVHDRSKMTPGFTIISGLTWQRGTYFGAIMLDADGREVHYWPIDLESILSNGRDQENVYIHGLEVFEDGSIVVDADFGDFLAGIGPCGDVLWVLYEPHHHVVIRSYDGTLWSWLGDVLAQTDRTGKPLKRIRLIEDVIDRHGYHGIFAIHAWGEVDAIRYLRDPFHPNDVEVLEPSMATAFPAFATGDILISLRNLNLLDLVAWIIPKDVLSLCFSTPGIT